MKARVGRNAADSDHKPLAFLYKGCTMKRLPSLKEWADSVGVDIHIAEKYQRVRSNWMKNVNRFAKKTGTSPIAMRPRDIRTFSKSPFRLMDDIVESEIVKWDVRNKRFKTYVTEKAQTYLSNILLAQNSTGSPDDDWMAQKAWKKLNKISSENYAKLADEISKAIGEGDVIYKPDENGPELAFDFEKVYKIIKNFKGGK